MVEFDTIMQFQSVVLYTTREFFNSRVRRRATINFRIRNLKDMKTLTITMVVAIAAMLVAADEPKQDYYKLLGVKKNATLKQIKQAYRELAMKQRPRKSLVNWRMHTRSCPTRSSEKSMMSGVMTHLSTAKEVNNNSMVIR